MSPENRRKMVERQLAKSRASLEGAELLQRGGFHDDAISRAYYAVFHAARAALATVGVQPRTHKGVNQRFNSELVLTGKIEAEYLSLLGHIQMLREEADYVIESSHSAEQAEEEIRAARRFLDRIEQYVASAGLGL